MAYARWREGVSSVFVFAHVGGGVQCCGCLLRGDYGPRFYSPGDLLEHFKQHIVAGHQVPEHLLNADTYDPEDFKENLHT